MPFQCLLAVIWADSNRSLHSRLLGHSGDDLLSRPGPSSVSPPEERSEFPGKPQVASRTEPGRNGAEVAVRKSALTPARGSRSGGAARGPRRRPERRVLRRCRPMRGWPVRWRRGLPPSRRPRPPRNSPQAPRAAAGAPREPERRTPRAADSRRGLPGGPARCAATLRTSRPATRRPGMSRMPSRCPTPLLVQLPEHFCHDGPAELAPLILAERRATSAGRPAAAPQAAMPGTGLTITGRPGRACWRQHRAPPPAKIRWVRMSSQRPTAPSGQHVPRPATAPISGSRLPGSSANQDSGLAHGQRLADAAGLVHGADPPARIRTCAGRRAGSLAAGHDRRLLIRRLARLTGTLPRRRAHRSAHPRRARAGRTAGIGCDAYKGSTCPGRQPGPPVPARAG